MRKKIVDKLIELKNTYGEELLLDKRRLLAFIKDYFPFAKSEHQLLLRGMEIDVYQSMKTCDLERYISMRNKCINTLHAKKCMDRGEAEDAVDLWLNFIRKESGLETTFSEDELLLKTTDKATMQHLRSCHKMAKLGDVEAILKIAHSYYNGEGLVQNYEEAMKWYQKAAAQHDVNAMNYMGNMYYMGEGVSQNYKEALKWYQKAAALESAIAMNYIGNIYYEGKGITADIKEAMKWYQRATRLGNYTAIFNIGYIYYQEHVGEHKQTLEQYEKEALTGNVEAMSHLAYMYHTGDGTIQDYNKALKWYHKIAQLGHTSAIIWIAYMHLNGQGVKKDYDEAMRWCKKATYTLE